MTTQHQSYPQDAASLPRVTELADISSADHDFTAGNTRPGAGKGLLITAPSGGGTVVLRLAGDSDDRSLVYPAGTHFLPAHVSHIRQTGTTTGVQVLGLMR